MQPFINEEGMKTPPVPNFELEIERIEYLMAELLKESKDLANGFGLPPMAVLMELKATQRGLNETISKVCACRRQIKTLGELQNVPRETTGDPHVNA